MDKATHGATDALDFCTLYESRCRECQKPIATAAATCSNCGATVRNVRPHSAFTRDYLRELNRVMTRGYMVIRPRQQPDSPRERLRSQIIIGIFLIVFLIGLVMAILGKL